MASRHVPLFATLTSICAALVFGVHCGGPGNSTSGASGFAEAQLDCQAAVGQLVDCCPGFGPGNLMCDGTKHTASVSSCAGTTTGTTTYPTLSQSESLCITGETCAELTATKVCSRAIRVLGMAPRTIVTHVGGASDQTYYEDAPVDGSELPDADAGLVCP